MSRTTLAFVVSATTSSCVAIGVYRPGPLLTDVKTRNGFVAATVEREGVRASIAIARDHPSPRLTSRDFWE